MEHPLAAIVALSLNTALHFGYDELLDWSSEQIAVDMLDYDASLMVLDEAYSVADLVPYINEWRAGLPPR